MRVTLDGGDLTVAYDGKSIEMSGPVQLSFQGSFEASLFSGGESSESSDGSKGSKGSDQNNKGCPSSGVSYL
jgi:hypothetical protein